MSKQGTTFNLRSLQRRIAWIIGLIGLALSGCAPDQTPPTAVAAVPLGAEVTPTPAEKATPSMSAMSAMSAMSSLLITPAVAKPGETISIHGDGFQPEEPIMVVVRIAEASYLYGAQATENGDYAQEIMLFDTLPLGSSVIIEARGHESGWQLQGVMQIAAQPSGN